MDKIRVKYEYIYLFINDIEHLYDINKNSYGVYNYTDKNINKNKIFYFVDNGHITGINIPVPTLSHFLVTTINESLLRDIHQGIYRLRLLGYCQYVTIIQNDINEINTNNEHMHKNNITQQKKFDKKKLIIE